MARAGLYKGAVLDYGGRRVRRTPAGTPVRAIWRIGREVDSDAMLCKMKACPHSSTI